VGVNDFWEGMAAEDLSSVMNKEEAAMSGAASS
jgi:hypothetical protein